MADWACPIDRAPPRKTLSLRFLPPHPSSCDFVVVRGGVSRVFAHSLHSFVGEAGCGGAVVGRGREGREKKEGGKEEERRWCTTVLLNLIIIRSLSLPPFFYDLITEEEEPPTSREREGTAWMQLSSPAQCHGSLELLCDEEAIFLHIKAWGKRER